MLKIGYFHCNPVFRENSWIASDGTTAVLVDPGFTDGKEFAPLAEYLRGENLRLEAIFITHGQSLISDGRGIGIEGFEYLLERIGKVFGSQVEWLTFSELAARA